ncbi:MAG: hypothetical protein EOO70_07420, partial [Myxococcaceae bacterium]
MKTNNALISSTLLALFSGSLLSVMTACSGDGFGGEDAGSSGSAGASGAAGQGGTGGAAGGGVGGAGSGGAGAAGAGAGGAGAGGSSGSSGQAGSGGDAPCDDTDVPPTDALFVAPDGSASGDGSADKPLASVQA